MREEVLILLSGGVDSAATLAWARTSGLHTRCLHIQYGQPAAGYEAAAAHAIAAHYSTPIEVITVAGHRAPDEGELPMRNALFVCLALLSRRTVSGVALGIHAGTSYYDCSEQFIADVRRLIEGSFVAPPALLTPFISVTKPAILAWCHEAEVPLHLTYSCERGTSPPCGECLSCIDRGVE